jgi:hypothetical protein
MDYWLLFRAVVFFILVSLLLWFVGTRDLDRLDRELYEDEGW